MTNLRDVINNSIIVRHICLLFLFILGYAIITGGLAILMTLKDEDKEKTTPAVAWILGGLLYTITVGLFIMYITTK
jgi:hypothetical protein